MSDFFGFDNLQQETNYFLHGVTAYNSFKAIQQRKEMLRLLRQNRELLQASQQQQNLARCRECGKLLKVSPEQQGATNLICKSCDNFYYGDVQCGHCGITVRCRLSDIGRVPLDCPDCKNELFVTNCSDCGKKMRYSPEQVGKTDLLCESCTLHNHVHCNSCGKLCRIREEQRGNTDLICPRCKLNLFVANCSNCGKSINISPEQVGNTNLLCKSCHAENHLRCKNCGKLYKIESKQRSSDDSVCQSCKDDLKKSIPLAKNGRIKIKAASPTQKIPKAKSKPKKSKLPRMIKSKPESKTKKQGANKTIAVNRAHDVREAKKVVDLDELKVSCPFCTGNIIYSIAQYGGKTIGCPHCNSEILLPKE
jgi:uncharacterized protein YbaR (Trm112 family)